MTITQIVNNKRGFIDGSIAKFESNPKLMKIWIQNNNIVISRILNSVSKEISASVIHAESAQEI